MPCSYPIIGDSASSSKRLVKESHGGVLWGFQSSPEGFPTGGVCQVMLISCNSSELCVVLQCLQTLGQQSVLKRRCRNITRIPCGVLTSLGLLTGSPSIVIPSLVLLGLRQVKVGIYSASFESGHFV